MVQAARSGVQNIAEGSMASGTSKKTELKLTNVARASLEELRLDYQDYLRQHGLREWHPDDPRRRGLIAARCRTADELAGWVRTNNGQYGQDGHSGHHGQDGLPASMMSMGSMLSIYAETTANAALVLIGVATSLLRRQLAAQERHFAAEGGFTERLYRVRSGLKR